MFIVKFEDGTEFNGGEPEMSMWDMIPQKLIKSIDYWITPNESAPETKHFVFTDFEEYCHMIEKAEGLNIDFNEITEARIMGRIKNRVYQIIFDFKTGEIRQDVTPWGQEYNGRALLGWRQGLLNQQPKLRII